jgi:hypothetical protein
MEEPLEIAFDLAQLAARFGGDGWAFRHDEGGLWWAQRPGALVGGDSPEALADLLAELVLPGEGEDGG